MNESPRIEAVLQVIKYMREPHTVTELAELINTTYRSVYRYVDAFNAAWTLVAYHEGNQSKWNLHRQKVRI